MINIKKLITFIVGFFVIYVLLNIAVPLTGLDKTYNTAFKSIGTVLYKNYGVRGKTEFVKAPKTGPAIFKHPFKSYDDNLMVKILNKDQVEAAMELGRKTGAASVDVNHAEFYINTWRFGMIPLILIASLILATPIPLVRRLIALLMGLSAISLFTAFRFWIRYVTEVNRHLWLEVGNLGPNSKWFVTHINTILYNFGISLIVAVLIWVVITFRKSDIGIFLTKEAEEEPELATAAAPKLSKKAQKKLDRKKKS